MIGRLCIIGVGLIGGSIALAARHRRLVNAIVGYDPDAANLQQALALGIVDSISSDVAEAAKQADIVVIAAPVGAMESILLALQPVWSEHCIYTDTGSTKVDVVAAARRVFHRLPGNLVPGHPIAGAERSGAGAAQAELYVGRKVILTPLPETDAGSVHRISGLWEALGARVFCMDPVHHDEVLAATSHLPHVLAFVLTEMLGRKDEQREIFQYAAGGFRDFTRIASSDPQMWRDICLANRKEIVLLIEQYRDALGQVADLLKQGDATHLLKLFADAQSARQRFLDQLEK